MPPDADGLKILMGPEAAGFAGPAIDDRQVFVGTIDGRRFVVRPHIQPKTSLQQFLCGDQQFAAFDDFFTDVIRQPAVGERNVFVFF